MLFRRFTAFIPTSAGQLAKAFMIAIVDDDKSVREAAKTLIKSLGYSTAAFASAEEFLESGCLHDAACLITDVQMPGMSGLDLQGHLTANGHSTPVILVTAYPEEGVRERALNAGAVGYLSKPLSEESLIACLDRAMEHCDSKSAE
jgi:FixJ family two-component response regulator